jgi:hypothetical protein
LSKTREKKCVQNTKKKKLYYAQKENYPLKEKKRTVEILQFPTENQYDEFTRKKKRRNNNEEQ